MCTIDVILYCKTFTCKLKFIANTTLFFLSSRLTENRVCKTNKTIKQFIKNFFFLTCPFLVVLYFIYSLFSIKDFLYTKALCLVLNKSFSII